ncbi:uncharacterized protein LOC131957117 [Physella acuta]|uniref:uncharacterized protein LOC131957117 n=1 Tax=Physella acuta TaxID=109671 RepID=UPI0027DBC731|nr:uncharacterized protein LOC131957117 [Physella acuta]
MTPLEVLFLALAVCHTLDLISSQAVEVDYTTLEVEGQILPDLVNVTLTTDTNTSHLQLSRVEHIHLDIPLYSLSVDSNGTFSQRRESSRHRKNIGYYQDIHSEAVFQLTRTNNIREKKAKLIIKGEYKHNDERYFIQPEVTPVQQATTSRLPSDEVVYTRTLKRNRPAGNMDYVIPRECQITKNTPMGYLNIKTLHIVSLSVY